MRREEERAADSTVFEGMTSIRAVLESGARRVERLLCDRERLDARAKELSYLRRKYSLEAEAVGASDIEAISTGSSHGGLVAVCGARELPALDAASVKRGGFYVMPEGIEDPYNFGYAVRSVYAAGADGIILSPRNWMSAAGVVCRASAGASERADIRVAQSAVEAAAVMRSLGYRIVCADTENAVPMYDADLTAPVFLIVGGERRGISRAVLDTADAVVRIGYGREFEAALSAASAATVLAFEALRQRQMKRRG